MALTWDQYSQLLHDFMNQGYDEDTAYVMADQIANSPENQATPAPVPFTQASIPADQIIPSNYSTPTSLPSAAPVVTPSDPMAMIRAAGIPDLWSPQIIDENNNMSEGSTPTFNEQGWLESPRQRDPNDYSQYLPAEPWYQKGPNGNAWVMNQSGQLVDSGQPFNDVDAGSSGFVGLLKLVAEFAAKAAAAAGMASGLGSLSNALNLSTLSQVAAETGSTLPEVAQVATSSGMQLAPEVEQALAQGLETGATTAQAPGFTQLAGATQSIPQLPMDYGIDFGPVTLPQTTVAPALSNIFPDGVPTPGPIAAPAPVTPPPAPSILTPSNLLTGASLAATAAGLSGAADGSTGLIPPAGALGENLPNLNTGSAVYPQLGLNPESVSGPGFQLPATTTFGQTPLPNIIPPGTTLPNTVGPPTTAGELITPSLPNIGVAPGIPSTVTDPAASVGTTGGVPGGVTDWIKQNAPWLLPALGAVAGGIGADGKPAGTITTVQDIPERLQPFQMGLINDAKSLYETQKAQTNPLIGEAQTALGNTIAGRDFIPDTNNPYIGQTTAPASNPYIGQTTPQATNPYIGQTTSVGTNPYLGLNNPYLEGALTKTLNDVQGRVNAQFGQSAFGSSANQELLARNLADASNQMRYQDYGLQAQLGESDVARRLAAQQADIARNASLQQQLGTFNAGLTQADLARNASLQQQLGTFNAGLNQADITRNASLWGTDAARNLQNQQANRTRQQAAALAAPTFATGATNAAFDPYRNYQGILSGWGGGTNTSPYFSNTAGGILSGALAGYGATKLFG